MEDKQLTLHNGENNITNTILAMAEVKNSIDKATLNYATILKEYAIKISQVKEQIKLQESKTEVFENRLKILVQDIDYEIRLLKRLNDSFVKKADIIEEFQVEFEDTLDEDKFKTLHRRKIKDMIQLTDEIEEVEQTLLEKELQRLNLLDELEPYQNRLEELQQELSSLELEKDHYESIQIHNLSNITHKDESKVSSDDDIVEIEVS
jgi:chromosome segregation ATPase